MPFVYGRNTDILAQTVRQVSKFLSNAVARKSQLPFGLAPMRETSPGKVETLHFRYHWDFQYFMGDIGEGIVVPYVEPTFPVWCRFVSTTALYEAFMWQQFGIFWQTEAPANLTMPCFGLALQRASVNARLHIVREVRRRGCKYGSRGEIELAQKRSFYKFQALEA